jgi:hypothetical protein
MTRKLPQPVCTHFCDDLLVDPKTAKFHVIGSYDCIRAASFPHRPRVFHVVALLTGTTGKYACRVRCFDPTDKPVFESHENEFSFRSPRQVVWASFRVLDVRFSRPGIYRFQIVCENHPVCERSMSVFPKGGNGDV